MWAPLLKQFEARSRRGHAAQRQDLRVLPGLQADRCSRLGWGVALLALSRTLCACGSGDRNPYASAVADDHGTIDAGYIASAQSDAQATDASIRESSSATGSNHDAMSFAVDDGEDPEGAMSVAVDDAPITDGDMDDESAPGDASQGDDAERSEASGSDDKLDDVDGAGGNGGTNRDSDANGSSETDSDAGPSGSETEDVSDTDPATTDSVELTPSAFAGNCVIRYPDSWLTRDELQLVLLCDSHSFALQPLDGTESTTIAILGEGSEAPESVFMNDLGLYYLDGATLRRASLGPGVWVTTVAPDAASPQLTSQRVVYLAEGGTILRSVPLLGGDPTTLSDPEEPITKFWVAPGGFRVFALDTSATLLSYSLEGGDPANLGRISLSVAGTDLAFSPNGSTVVYFTDPEQPEDPRALAVTTLAETPFTFSGEFDTGGGGANRMVFTRTGDRVVVDWTAAEQAPPNRHLDSVAITGEPNTPLANADELRFYDLVGPLRGAALYHARTGTQSPTLEIIDAEGGETTLLSTLGDCVSQTRDAVALSPDRVSAAYYDALGDLVLADLDARTALPLVEAAMTEERLCTGRLPLWSPDGNKLAYEHCASNLECEIRVVNTQGYAFATLCGAALSGIYFAPDSQSVICSDALGGKVFSLRSSDVEVFTFDGAIALSTEDGRPLATRFVPAKFPWIDNSRFVVELGAGADAVTAIVDMHQP